MIMILGFGKVEDDTARTIMRECYKALGSDLGKDVHEIIRSIENDNKQSSDKYDKMSKSEAPERYSRFWTCTYNKYVEFVFHHINRRHAFSPDGWALLKTVWILDTETGAIFHE